MVRIHARMPAVSEHKCFVQTVNQALHLRHANCALNWWLNSSSNHKIHAALAMLKWKIHARFDHLRTKQVVQSEQRTQLDRQCTGAKWIPATVVAQTCPASYKVHTWENVIWEAAGHEDQLLSSTRPVSTFSSYFARSAHIKLPHHHTLTEPNSHSYPSLVRCAPESLAV